LDNRDQKEYKMVKIGQYYLDGRKPEWECDGSFIYEDLPKNLKKFGRLYSYEAAQNACPASTHLPTKQDWIPCNIMQILKMKALPEKSL